MSKFNQLKESIESYVERLSPPSFRVWMYFSTRLDTRDKIVMVLFVDCKLLTVFQVFQYSFRLIMWWISRNPAAFDVFLLKMLTVASERAKNSRQWFKLFKSFDELHKALDHYNKLISNKQTIVLSDIIIISCHLCLSVHWLCENIRFVNALIDLPTGSQTEATGNMFWYDVC